VSTAVPPGVPKLVLKPARIVAAHDMGENGVSPEILYYSRPHGWPL